MWKRISYILSVYIIKEHEKMKMQKSEYMEGFLFKKGEKAEFVPKHVVDGNLPTGKISSMSDEEKERVVQCMDFVTTFHDISHVESIMPFEGYFGVLTVGPYWSKEAAMAKIKAIPWDDSLQDDDAVEIEEEEILQEEDFDLKGFDLGLDDDFDDDDMSDFEDSDDEVEYKDSDDSYGYYDEDMEDFDLDD